MTAYDIDWTPTSDDICWHGRLIHSDIDWTPTNDDICWHG